LALCIPALAQAINGVDNPVVLEALVKNKTMTAAEMGRARWKGLTKSQRSEIGRAAVNARWVKARKAKNKRPKRPKEER
jgi:hypothetical protein